MRIRALVPRLADEGERDRLWEYCRAHWETELPEMEIVEGAHEGDGPFNRSAAINRAAEGEWDVAVILDSDVLLDADKVRAGIAAAAESGWLVLPYRDRNMISRQGTSRILGGFRGSWRRWIVAREAERVSCCVIIPRALWDAVGGFDERFEGWGGEDEAFYAACKAIAGAERLDGEVWHLFHQLSPHRDHRTALYRQALQLRNRYMNVEDAEAMRRFLAEPRGADQIVLVALTNGERDTLKPTLESARDHLQGPIGRRLLCVDAVDHRVAELAKRFPAWDVVQIRGGDYSRAVSGALDQAVGSGQAWVFWLEDDFRFEGDIDLAEMQRLVERDDLAQLSLKRQPWFEHELEAGGVIEADPDSFTQRDGYVEHRAYWTMNPMLTKRSTLASHRWPRGRDSERRFGLTVFRDPDARVGMLGEIDDPPRVEHIGLERAGVGY